MLFATLALHALIASANMPSNCIGCDMAHMDLHGADLHDARYTGTDLDHANLRGANLRGARLIGCNLRGADLRNADLRGASLTGADLQGAQLAGADLAGTRFTGASLRGADATGVRFDGDELVGTDFRDAHLRGASFERTWLCFYSHDNDADGRSARSEGCDDFSGADVTGAVLRGAQLCDDERGSKTCMPVDAATLRSLAHNSFDGAILP